MTYALVQWFGILAQAATEPDKPAGKASSGGFDPMILMIGAIIVFLVFTMVMGKGRQKKEQRARELMMAALAKNDKVVTIGGIFGVVTDVKEDEVTLKIDENTNTKIRVRRRAVAHILTKDGEEKDGEKG